MRPPSPPLTTSPVLASVARKPTPIRTPGGTSGGARPGAPGGRSAATWPTFGQVTLTTDPLPTTGDAVGVASAAGAGDTDRIPRRGQRVRCERDLPERWPGGRAPAPRRAWSRAAAGAARRANRRGLSSHGCQDR